MLTSMGFLSWYHRLVHSEKRPPTVEATRSAAERGDPQAQFGLGLKFSTANDSPSDLDQAAYWYRKAAGSSIQE